MEAVAEVLSVLYVIICQQLICVCSNPVSCTIVYLIYGCTNYSAALIIIPLQFVSNIPHTINLI